MEHSEETKKKRRKIEEVLRKSCTEEEILALAVLLKVDKNDTEEKK